MEEKSVVHKSGGGLTALPRDVVQTHIFCHFSALELFKMRLISEEWDETIKKIWCHRVKDEMMEQVSAACHLDPLFGLTL